MLRIQRPRLIPAIAGLAVLLLGIAGRPAAAEELVLGYYPAWVRESFPAEKVDFGILTHVVHAFAWPEADGSIAVWENFHYPELVQAAHDAGRVITVAFGGWGQCEGFPPMAADPAIRKRFIDNVFAFCREHGYDGIDLDWEFPANPAERDDLTTLVTEIRAEADRRGKPFLVTMAVSAGTWSGDHNDYEKLVGAIDWFNDMTYDFYGTWTDRAGHNAPLYATQESVDTSVRYLTEKMGVPPEKIMLGMPFYGRRFKTDGLYGTRVGGGDGVVYRDIAVLRDAEDGWEYRWDDVSLAPYLVHERNREIVFYDEPESIAIKCEYARIMKLRGVMIWSLGSDFIDGRQPLLETIGRTLGK